MKRGRICQKNVKTQLTEGLASHKVRTTVVSLCAKVEGRAIWHFYHKGKICPTPIRNMVKIMDHNKILTFAMVGSVLDTCLGTKSRISWIKLP